jgi:hypothetical protein
MIRRLVGGLVAVIVLAGCGSGGTPSGTASLAASESASAEARIYPYTVPWPDSDIETKWRYADTVWDGEARIDHGNEYTDAVRTNDGDLFAFGYETSGSAADLQALTARQAAEWHGCTEEPSDEQPLTAGGEEGILAVHDCGGQTVLRWFGVHDGFGLAVALILASDADPATARAHFEERIGQLVWAE